MTDLIPCRFCGCNIASMTRRVTEACYRVECDNCQAYGLCTKTEQEAVDAWNGRGE